MHSLALWHWLEPFWSILYQSHLTNALRSFITPHRIWLIIFFVHCSNTNLLSVPRVHIISASRGFSFAAPSVWNSLPADIHACSSPHTFCRLLKPTVWIRPSVPSSGSHHLTSAHFSAVVLFPSPHCILCSRDHWRRQLWGTGAPAPVPPPWIWTVWFFWSLQSHTDSWHWTLYVVACPERIYTVSKKPLSGLKDEKLIKESKPT